MKKKLVGATALRIELEKAGVNPVPNNTTLYTAGKKHKFALPQDTGAGRFLWLFDMEKAIAYYTQSLKEGWLAIQEIANKLNIPISTIYCWKNKGFIQSIKLRGKEYLNIDEVKGRKYAKHKKHVIRNKDGNNE